MLGATDIKVQTVTGGVKQKVTAEGQDPPNGGGPNRAAEPVLAIPESAKIPPGATFYEGQDDGRCRIVKPDGNRCGGTRMRRYGLCPGHAGVGGVSIDPAGASRLAAARRGELRERRMLLGVSARRGASPVQVARLAATKRAQDFAKAIVDAPLDDAELGTTARQLAAIRAVELLYPQVTAQLDVTLPESEQDARSMGWQEMQALAARLFDEDGAGMGHPTLDQ